MHSLVKQTGLIDSLYRGSWKGGKRSGFGIQLFPNGAKFIGNWANDAAEGFGRLDFVDGTLYEGHFVENLLQWGRLQYFSGTYFEGQFDGARDLFKSGKIVFRDGETFVGSWSPEGVVLSGDLFTYDGKKLRLSDADLVREPVLNYSAKIIYWKKGLIYEGGLRKGNYDKKGFVYGNSMNPFYFESNYQSGRFHGRYVYTSLYHGFSTEEYYVKGKEIGTWRYRTSKGYEYVGDTSSKKQLVRFPFLNKDYYEGDLNIWCENITLSAGTYHMFEAEKAEFKQIRVINCDSITTQKDVKKNYNSFDQVYDLIEKAVKEGKRATFGSEGGVFFYDDGSSFKGHIIGNFVVCHKNDLPKFFSQRKAGAAHNKWDLKHFPGYYLNRVDSSLAVESTDSLKFFRGTIVEGKKVGYCHLINQQDNEYRGFYENNQQSGSGFYHVKDKYKFVGQFRENRIEGQGTMWTSNQQVLKGDFIDGMLNGLGYVKYLGNNLEFFGQIVRNLRQGKGVLKFVNNYRFEGNFKEDKIDTSEKMGKLVCKDTETVEEGIFVPSQDLSVGFLQTTEGSYYIFDFKSGTVKKTV